MSINTPKKLSSSINKRRISSRKKLKRQSANRINAFLKDLAVTNSNNSSIIISPNQKNNHNTGNSSQISKVNVENKQANVTRSLIPIRILKPRELLMNTPYVHKQYKVAQTTQVNFNEVKRKINFAEFIERNTPLKSDKVR
jgi:hypothetical protein